MILHLLHHGDCLPALELARSALRWLSIDPGRPVSDRLGVDVRIWTNPDQAEAAFQSDDLLIVLVDPLMANASVESPGLNAWFRQLGLSASGRVVPVRLTTRTSTVPLAISPLGNFNAVVLSLDDETTRDFRFRFQVGEFLLRHLLAKSGSQRATDARVHLFLSHAKRDGLDRTDEFRAWLDRSGVDAFFDARDIPIGSDWREVIRDGVRKAAVVLVIRSDLYVTRFWCREELRVAQEHGVPIVIADHLAQRESRVTSLLAEAPTIRIGDPESYWRVFLQCFEAALRRMLFLNRSGQDRNALPVAPNWWSEQVRWSDAMGDAPIRRMTYPDPPLPKNESDTLNAIAGKSGFEYMSQHEAIAAGIGATAGQSVALSIGNVPDAELATKGITQDRIRHVFCSVARLIVLAKLRPCYGGDWRLGGYTETLEEMMHELVDLEDQSTALRMRNYLAPVYAAEFTETRRAELQPWCEVIIVEAIEGDLATRQQVELSHMRRRMAEDCVARVVLGGKTQGYSGIVPGILEEVFWMQALGKPTLALTGFGGAAAWCADPDQFAVFRALWMDYAGRKNLIDAAHRARLEDSPAPILVDTVDTEQVIRTVAMFLMGTQSH